MKNLWCGLAFCLVIICYLLPSDVAAQSQPPKLEGQIVCCEDCWAREDRRTVPYGTADDLAKAQMCVANGDPTLLAVMNNGGAITLYQLEDGKFKRPGENWLEFIGRRVEVMGPVRERGGRRFVKVDALTVLAPSIAETQQAKAVGTEAELALPDLSGVAQRLSQFRGRVVVLNFWATYCAPCRKEMPDLAAMQNEYAALGVQVIGASADPAGDRAKVLQFIKETKLNFPVWLGATVADMAKFGLGPALPGTAIIDREGKIKWTSGRVVKASEVKQQLDALLAPSSDTAAASSSTPAAIVGEEAEKKSKSTEASAEETSSVPS